MKRSKFYDEAIKRRDSLFDIAYMLRTLSLFSDREYRLSIDGNRNYTVETFIDNQPVDTFRFCETFYMCHYLLKEIDKLKEKRSNRDQETKTVNGERNRSFSVSVFQSSKSREHLKH